MLVIVLCASGVHAAQKPMTKQLVFIGDSLTEWFDWQRRFPRETVLNLGLAGDSLEGLLMRREQIRRRIGDKQPDYIFVMIGINNLVNGRHDISEPYREFVRNLTTWYKRSKVVIQSILPATTWISNTVVQDTNRTLEHIARENQADYLDLYGVFLDGKGNPKPGYLQEDGLHLSVKGYVAWSREVERYLKKRQQSVMVKQ